MAAITILLWCGATNIWLAILLSGDNRAWAAIGLVSAWIALVFTVRAAIRHAAIRNVR